MRAQKILIQSMVYAIVFCGAAQAFYDEGATVEAVEVSAPATASASPSTHDAPKGADPVVSAPDVAIKVSHKDFLPGTKMLEQGIVMRAVDKSIAVEAAKAQTPTVMPVVFVADTVTILPVGDPVPIGGDAGGEVEIG